MKVQQAYDILSDDAKRAAFDRHGHTGDHPGFDPSGGAGGFPGGFPGFGNMNSDDMFSSFFNGLHSRSRRSGPRVGSDIQASVTINFMEAVHGTTVNVSVPRTVNCKSCSGTGANPGSKPLICSTCNGSGHVAIKVQGFEMVAECTSCGGQGKTIPASARCRSCRGSGKVQETKTVPVKIPAGVDDDMHIRINGEGNMPEGGNGVAGNLILRLFVQPSSTFRRQGADVFITTKVPYTTAILGGYVRVPTLDGDVELKIPPGTQPGGSSVLRNKGIQRVNYPGRGDQFVEINVELPTKLTQKQRELIEQLASADTNTGTESKSESTTTKSTTEDSGNLFRSTFEKIKDKVENVLHHKDDKEGGDKSK